MVAENIGGKTQSLALLHVRPASLQRYTPQKPLTKQVDYSNEIPMYFLFENSLTLLLSNRMECI